MKQRDPANPCQRILSLSLWILMLFCFSGCGGDTSTPTAPEEGEIAKFIAENPEFANASDDSVEQLNTDE